MECLFTTEFIALTYWRLHSIPINRFDDFERFLIPINYIDILRSIIDVAVVLSKGVRGLRSASFMLES